VLVFAWAGALRIELSASAEVLAVPAWTPVVVRAALLGVMNVRGDIRAVAISARS